MNTKISNTYPLYVWVSVNFAGAFLHSLFLMINNGSNLITFLNSVFWLFTIISSLSLPVWAIHTSVVKILNRKAGEIILKKSIAGITAIVLLFLTFILMVSVFPTNFTHPKVIAFFVTYTLAIVVFTFLYQ